MSFEISQRRRTWQCREAERFLQYSKNGQSTSAIICVMHESSTDGVHDSTGDLEMLVGIAVAMVLLHLVTDGKYGFQRDELATLDDARHLAWGYVAYPPMTPFFGRLSLEFFGTSLRGFRFFAGVATAATLVLTGLMTRDLGGRRGAQLVAVAAATSFAIAGGVMMQYVAFDYLAWVLTAYCIVRLLKSEDARWWLGIGAAIGLGAMAKYNIAFFVAGVVAAVVLTPVRKYLLSKWLWFGVALSLLIWFPNLLWQIQHHFISLDFLRHIHARDTRIGRTQSFLPDQLKLSAVIIWLPGLYYCLIAKEGKRYRMLAWMYLVPLVIYCLIKARAYYLAGAYPMLYAAGAVWLEQKLAQMGRAPANLVRVAAWALLLLTISLTSAVTLPIAPINSAWFTFASKINGDYREELGWPELARTVAQIRDSLPAAEREHLGVLGANYGEAGAIALYGPQYGLPTPISGVNSFWERGYGNPPPQTLIVIGLSQGKRDEIFSSCELAGHTGNPYGIENEETQDHPDIFVCRGMRKSWPEFWKDFRYYG